MKRGALAVGSEERFAFLTKVPLERLTSCAQARHYIKGAPICADAQLSEAAYFILSGSCELRTTGLDEEEEEILTLGPGRVFGGLEQLLPDNSRTSAVAASECVLFRIERHHLELLRAEASAQIPGTEPIALSVSSSADQLSRGGQVVALTFLPSQLPASLIAEGLARWLCAETGRSVLLVRLEAQDAEGPQSAPILNGEFHMPPRVIKSEAGYHFLTLAIGSEGPSAAGIASLVGRLRSQFKYVLIQAPATDRPRPWLVELLARSDST